MTVWPDRNCFRCADVYQPKREGQRYCSTRCRMADAHQRRRSVDKSEDASSERRTVDGACTPSETGLRPYVWQTPPCGLEETQLNSDGSTPGALQGDAIELEYYEDGYPKLPACLDRKPLAFSEAAT